MSDERSRRRSSAEYGSDYVVEILKELGIDVVAFNPGASFRGLHDSLVNHPAAQGMELVLCLHEEIAVGVAHGYAKASGKPAAAIVHDIVGLQHASMAIYNAWIDRAPVFVLGGTGPFDSTARRPWIDWIHTANVQGQLVRDYVKFDDQPASIPAIGDSMVRAFRTMMMDPQGPVYVNLDATHQEARAPADLELPDTPRLVNLTRLAPDRRAIAALADLLLEAQCPVLISERLPRAGEAMQALVELAELAGIAMLPDESHYSFPTEHRLNLAGRRKELLGRADLVIAIDTRKLVFPDRAGCRIATIGSAELGIRSWSHDFGQLQGADINLIADPLLAIEALIEAMRERETPARKKTIEERIAQLERMQAEQRAEWRDAVEKSATASPISPAFLSATLGQKIRDRDAVLAFKSYSPWPLRTWKLDRPAQYPGPSGGGGVGYGIAGTIGVALAHRGSGRLIVDLQPDGDLLYSTSALWTLAHLKLPVLIVMDNNRTYRNSEQHAEEIARARQRPLERAEIGTQIRDPAVDFASVARGFGIHAEGPISDPSQLGAALDRALVKVRSGPVLLDVLTT